MLDAALVEHGDPAADRIGAAHVVGDDDTRDAEPFAHAHHQLIDDGARDRVESRRRLVIQDVLRTQRDRAGNADALSHTAGEFGGEPRVHAG